MTGKTEVVRVRTTSHEYSALHYFANAHDCTVSEVLRQLIHQYVMGEAGDIEFRDATICEDGGNKVTDVVDHPAHYNAIAGVECIDVVQHFDFCTGNAIKYLWRAGLKPGADRIEDLRKAAWYVQRAIAKAEQENANGCK